MSGLIYNTLLILLSPAVFAGYLWRVFVSRKSNESWRQNLGALPRLADRPAGRKLVWLHAASVGEVAASLPVQEEIKRLIPNCALLVTTITQTGNAVARKSARHADAVAYLPADYPALVRRAFDRVRPDALVIVEVEIWPNLLAEAERRGIPTILVNGRISDRSLRRARRWRWLMSWAVSNVDFCCMQTKTDADSIVQLGARPEWVQVVGSSKFDQEGGRLDEDAVRELRADLRLPDGTPVFVVGSTNPGEDEPVLSAFSAMRESVPGLRLIVAPRQLERAEEIQALAESRGLRCDRRSRQGGGDFDVLALDSFGELGRVYAVGDIAFVGGTLVPKGGHSLIQPILQGKPVLFGPHTFKTRDVARTALAAGVGFEVRDADDLAEQGRALLLDPERRKSIDTACERLVSESRGASVRCAEIIAGFIR